MPEGNAPLRHGFLSAWEHVELRGLRPRSLAAHSDGRAVAALPGRFYDMDLPAMAAPLVAPAADVVRRLWPGFLFARTYEIGSATPLVNPFLGDAGALIAPAVEAAERGGAQFVVVQNFASPGGPARELLAPFGFTCVPIPPTAVIDLPYDCFDDYLAAMRRRYRRRARETLQQSEELRAEHLPDFEEPADELARLWRVVYHRAGEAKREIYTPAFFREAAKLEEVSVLLMRRRDGSIASFALLLADGPWLWFLQCGFEEEAGRQEGAYFRLLYEVIRFGIENGFEQVDLGPTTLEPKLYVGAVPVPLFAWVRPRRRALQRVLRAVAARGLITAPEAAPHHVFKDAPPSAAELVRRRGLPL